MRHDGFVHHVLSRCQRLCAQLVRELLRLTRIADSALALQVVGVDLERQQLEPRVRAQRVDQRALARAVRPGDHEQTGRVVFHRSASAVGGIGVGRGREASGPDVA
jgi:hypothetical protein